MGKRSTASIEISVHVNQTLTSIHPEQLLVNSTTPITMHDSQPFCIVNQGYGLEASVPYDLKVDALNIQTINGAPAYTIYIKENKLSNQKLALATGRSLTNQSEVTFSDVLKDECEKKGMIIAIEHTHPHASTNSVLDNPGLLILLISPI